MRMNTNWTLYLTVVTLMLTSMSAAQQAELDQDERQTARTQSNTKAVERQQADTISASLARDPAVGERDAQARSFGALQGSTAIAPQQLPNQYNFGTSGLLNGLLNGQDNLTGNPFGQMNSQLATTYQQANQKLAVLVQALKGADDEEPKLEIKAKIKTLLDEKYDAYLEHHEAPLKQLEERLEKLRAEFESRKKAKDDLVKLRLDTIWYDAIGLGWPENQRGSAFSSTVRGLNFPSVLQSGPRPNTNMRLPANPFNQNPPAPRAPNHLP
ncbi:MAG: hypothetical protein ACI814_002534 [Mariniblastus sp.]|jgi:hypothetical protein